MARPRTRDDTFAITIHVPNKYREDMKLLARYNYSSLNSEINKAIAEYMEKNRELLESEKASLQS